MLVGFKVSRTLYHIEGMVAIVRVEIIEGADFYICLNYLDVDWDIPELLVSSIHLHGVSILDKSYQYRCEAVMANND